VSGGGAARPRPGPAALAEVLLLGAVFLLPLIVWPGLVQPFSTPKRWLLAGAAILLWPLAWRGQGAAAAPLPLRLVTGAWLASWALSALLAPHVFLDALVLGVAGPLWALALVRAAPAPRAVAAAHTAAATLVAAIALLQRTGADPFTWAGWAPLVQGGSERLRVYATLGNPNFVAALLAASVPLALALASTTARPLPRAAALGASVAQAAAVAATGSRAGALALGAGLAVWAAVGPWRRRGLLLVLAALVVAVLVALSPARPLADTLRGRLYVWRIAAAHALDHPGLGAGPGAFEAVYPDWEARARQTAPPSAADLVYAGPQPHAHNDFLEALVERGLPGFATILTLFTTSLVRGGRGGRESAADRGAAGALAALAAAATVDFPLARPAEAALCWTAVAIIFTRRRDLDGGSPLADDR